MKPFEKLIVTQILMKMLIKIGRILISSNNFIHSTYILTHKVASNNFIHNTYILTPKVVCKVSEIFTMPNLRKI